MSTDGLTKHPLTKKLYTDQKILFSEKIADLDMAVAEDAYQTWSYKGMRGIINRLLGNKYISEETR